MLRLTCKVSKQEWTFSFEVQKEVAVALLVAQVMLIAAKLLI